MYVCMYVLYICIHNILILGQNKIIAKETVKVKSKSRS